MDKKICEKCGTVLKHYDRVTRIVKGKGGVKSYIHVERYRCPKCKTIHGFLPECVHPYKQYDAEIIDGVIEGLIDSDTLGFEDYPCEMTMKRWRSHNLTPKI